MKKQGIPKTVLAEGIPCFYSEWLRRKLFVCFPVLGRRHAVFLLEEPCKISLCKVSQGTGNFVYTLIRHLQKQSSSFFQLGINDKGGKIVSCNRFEQPA